MRLIDADRLDEEIRSFLLMITGNPKQSTVVNECKSSFRRIIDEQPTAYDVDRVAEQLEASAYLTWPTFNCEGDSNDDEDEVINIDKAIDIVKGGGDDA